ncbi:methyltransferase type 11 [Streptomyces caeruleatus]|uniref:Methyltransferase type 11 n=2 Tax=Streptomyces caeruleatus TaxID=661399 RepID=A0A101TFF2_9ACTN|nr:methyltransferase type 11 [Streptomyces caeruleatus]
MTDPQRAGQPDGRTCGEPDGKEALAGLFDRNAPSYERVGVDHFAQLGQRLVAHARLRPGQRVLDVGCGTGAVLVPAARAVGVHGEVTGLDLSAGMVARAREEIARLGLVQARAVQGDAETVSPRDLPVAAGSLDAVLAGICLFFFPRPHVATARYRELLRPGGRLAVSWWGEGDPHWTPVFVASAPYGRAASWHTVGDASPFRSVPAFHALLAEVGFTEVETVEEECVTRFADAEQWWRWLWSTAGRQFWEGVPEDSRPAAEAAVNAELARLTAPDGSLTSRSTVRFTLARRPR